MSGPVGVVYLLHFSEAFKHARHYVGFCEKYENLDSRFDYHSNGNGSKLLAAVSAAGIKFKCVRLWTGTRSDERRIKNGTHSAGYCPECCTRPRPRKPMTLTELDL